jgi:membrane-bound lytic murein transglycosylase D
LLNKLLILVFLALALCFGACSSTRSNPSKNSSLKTDSTDSLTLDPTLVSAEKILFSEVDEFVTLGLESMHDSLWFQAGEDFDSALVRLANLEATDSLSPNVYSIIRTYQDSVQKLLITTVSRTSQMSVPVPLTELFDAEMEEVSDSTVHVLDSITHKINPAAYDLPLTTPLDPRILQAISVFMGPGKGYFTKWLNRKSRYADIITQKLEERGMPKDLLYLAMVESGFNPKAWSKAAASGMWQFIAGTGRRYGLKDDWWIDPRRDPLLATDAALEYLGDLYAEFGDWHQAMAAYNCGEGRVRRYRNQDSSLNYWNMPLPQETRYYVPKILAAMIIGHNPERYGFKIDAPHAPLVFDTVTVQHCLSIAAIAKAAEVSEDTIISLNPALRRWCTPPNKAEYRVHLPTGTRDLFNHNYELLDKTQIVNWHHHVVGKGDNLSNIASRYRVSVSSIKATNKIKGNSLHRGQSLLIPMAPADALKYSEVDPMDEPSRGGKYKSGTYKVKKGDNLFDIARRFNTTVSKLLAANNMRSGSKLRAGQRLKLGVVGSRVLSRDLEAHTEPKVKSISAKEKGGKYLTYVVSSSDNIFSISRKLGIREDDLRRWNKIRGNRILVGQKLKYQTSIKTADTETDRDSESEPGATVASSSSDIQTSRAVKKSEEKVYYLVKSGDTMWDISVRHRSTIQKLKELNGSLPPVLKPGTRIRVR